MNLHGKTIAFLGDSITEGVGVADPSCRYDAIIQKRCGLASALNYGIGGTRIAHNCIASVQPVWDLNFCARAYRMDPNAEVIVVYGGTNDYGHGDAPFGSDADSTPDTFFGAVDFLMRLLLERYPNGQIVFMTPAKRQDGEAVREGIGKMPLSEYVKAIIQKGKQYQIPVLDLYQDLDIDPDLESDRLLYAPDGLHFNDAGHKRIAELLLSFLETL